MPIEAAHGAPLESLALKSLRYRRKISRSSNTRAPDTPAAGSRASTFSTFSTTASWGQPRRFADPRRDRYIQSKGHCVEALYVVLADRASSPSPSADAVPVPIPLCRASHPQGARGGAEHRCPGARAVPVRGYALAGKLDQLGNRGFTLLGDGSWLKAPTGRRPCRRRIIDWRTSSPLWIAIPCKSAAARAMCATASPWAPSSRIRLAYRSRGWPRSAAAEKALAAPAQQGKPTVFSLTLSKGVVSRSWRMLRSGTTACPMTRNIDRRSRKSTPPRPRRPGELARERAGTPMFSPRPGAGTRAGTHSG